MKLSGILLFVIILVIVGCIDGFSRMVFYFIFILMEVFLLVYMEFMKVFKVVVLFCRI